MGEDFPNPVNISAKLKLNLDMLLKKIEENFAFRMVRLEVLLPHGRMDLVDLFHREGKVEEIKYLQEGIQIKLNLTRMLVDKLLKDKKIKVIN